MTNNILCLRSSSKNEQKSAWLNRAGDLLDLSSGDSRDNTPNNVEGVFNQPQTQQVGAEQGISEDIYKETHTHIYNTYYLYCYTLL